MSSVMFRMNGDPIAKGRGKATVRNGFVKVYTPAKTRKYEASVRRVAMAQMAGRAPFTGPLGLSLRFRMPIPKSTTKRARAGMLAGEVAHTSRPDFDNLTKAILDAMNEVVFVDDAQFARAFITKVYAEQPGVDVKVEAFAPQGGEP